MVILKMAEIRAIRFQALIALNSRRCLAIASQWFVVASPYSIMKTTFSATLGLALAILLLQVQVLLINKKATLRLLGSTYHCSRIFHCKRSTNDRSEVE